MDPDSDYPPPHPGSNSGSGRKNRDKRIVSQDVAMPNSARRAARKPRGDRSEGGGGGGNKPPPSQSSSTRSGEYNKSKSSSSSMHKSSSREDKGSHHGSSRSRRHHDHGRNSSDRERSGKEKSHHSRKSSDDGGDEESDRETRSTQQKEGSGSRRHGHIRSERQHKSDIREQHKSSSKSRRDKDHSKIQDHHHHPRSSSNTNTSDSESDIGYDNRHEETSNFEAEYSTSQNTEVIEYSDSGCHTNEIESLDELKGDSTHSGGAQNYEDYLVHDDEDDDEDYDEFEDIEDTNYNEHCGDTTAGKSTKTGRSERSNRTIEKFDEDSELEELMNGDDAVQTRESMKPRELGHNDGGRGSGKSRRSSDASNRGNSPEINRNRGYDKYSHSDPPTSRELRHGTLDGKLDEYRPFTPPNMDPQFEDTKSYYSRLNAPPTPKGPEENKRSNNKQNSNSVVGGGGYSNYTLDEEGYRQYQQQKLGQPDDHKQYQQQMRQQLKDDVDDILSRCTPRGQDPPESGRGNDPKQIGNIDPLPSSSSRSNKYRSNRARTKGGKSRRSKKEEPPAKEELPASNTKVEEKKKKKKRPEKPQPEIKGILKKKNTPIPITQFGKLVNVSVASTPQDSDANSDNDHVSSGSDPDMTEQKQRAPPLQITNGDRDDDTVKSSGNKSGLRSGKYASLNVAAAAKQSGDSTDEDGSDSDYTGKSGNYSNDDFDSTYSKDDQTYDKDQSSSSSDDDDNTLKTIESKDNEKFVRSNSHFLRTADLGLTQDTIFAEQFLDDPNAKPEPHYHQPSPHPPPGVQFHIDENWVALDDGKGYHSPIAPQAVDALVAMGYRAACDPMMWTPTSKTRKYMTEKGLRFDDMPVPGPIEEGEGGSSDNNCLVWSGKFPHKYHGHEQPAVRSQGIVNMSPEELVDLLMDSRRVREYNKSSIGRVDEVVLSDGADLDKCPFSGQRKKKLSGVIIQGARIVDGNAVVDSETDDEQSDIEEEELVFDDDGKQSVRTITSRKERRQSLFVGVTKLVRTTNKPPLVRKVLEFFTLLHCRALTDDQGGDGYIIVGRGITPASEVEKSSKGKMHSEILLNVLIIRRLRNKKKRDRVKSSSKGNRSSKNVSTSGQKANKSDLAGRCLVINVNHMKSPMVPKMMAKKVGLSAALNFMTDIRALTN